MKDSAEPKGQSRAFRYWSRIRLPTITVLPPLKIWLPILFY